MQREILDTYINGEVQIDVCKAPDDKKDFWIKGGVGYVRFTEQGFADLSELLVSYEAAKGKKVITVHDPWQFWSIVVAVLLLMVLIIGV